MTEQTKSENTALTIGEVARLTGLTERALRHYEAEGLLSPLRRDNGRRAYRRGDLEQLAQIRLLKKAGFKIDQMRLLLEGRTDLIGLVGARLDALEGEMRRIQTSVSLLSSVQNQLAQGSDVSVDTLCALINNGEYAMQEQEWQKIYDRFYTADEQKEWARAKEEGFKDVDMAAYAKQWEELTERIKASLPLDPSSDKAQQYLAEWNALLEPFMRHATPTMLENAGRLYENVGEWGDSVNSPVTPEIWAFIKEAGEHAVV